MNDDCSVIPATVVCADENRLASAENAISGVTVVRADYVGAGVAAQGLESVDENAAVDQVNVANAYEPWSEIPETDVGLPVAAIACVASTAMLETYAAHAVNDCGCSCSDCTEKTRVRFQSCFRLQYTSSCSQCDASDSDLFPRPQVVSCPNTRYWSHVLSS